MTVKTGCCDQLFHKTTSASVAWYISVARVWRHAYTRALIQFDIETNTVASTVMASVCCLLLLLWKLQKVNLRKFHYSKRVTSCYWQLRQHCLINNTLTGALAADHADDLETTNCIVRLLADLKLFLKSHTQWLYILWEM